MICNWMRCLLPRQDGLLRRLRLDEMMVGKSFSGATQVERYAIEGREIKNYSLGGPRAAHLPLDTRPVGPQRKKNEKTIGKK